MPTDDLTMTTALNLALRSTVTILTHSVAHPR